MIKYIDKYFLKKPTFRKFLTKLIEGEKDKVVNMLGTDFKINSVKEHGYLRSARMMNSSSLLREELPVLINLASLISDNDTFIDIGANVGIYSATLSRISNVLKNVRFYAFEANPDTFSRLDFNSKNNNFQASNLAVSDINGNLEFVSGAVSHVFTTLENKSEYNFSKEIISVKASRLDRLPIEGDSIILKIDVEGQEMNVLEGSTSLFKKNRIKAVYLDGFDDQNVISFLRRYDFTFRDGKTLEPVPGNTFNLLALKNL